VRRIAILFLLCATAQTLTAQDWRQWRGPSRNGVVAGASTPPNWPDALHTRWRTEVGEGYSSPVVAVGRVFVHSRRDPEELVTAIDLATGKIVWQQKYATAFKKNQYAMNMAKGPHATPLVVDGRLFTLGGMGVISAWNAATGSLVWRKDYSPSVDTSKLFTGTSASPLAEGGHIIVQVGSDVHGGQVLALNPRTGDERWTWRGNGPGYASPVAITVNGVRQLVTLTDSSIEGINPTTGGSLWTVPFPDDWHENIMTPVWTGTHVIVSGPRQGTHALALRQQAGKWQATEAWKNPDVTMYMSTPVLKDGILYGFSNKRRGQFVAMDAATGTVRWATEGRAGEHASILSTPAHVIFLTNKSDLILVRPSPAGFEEVRRYNVADSETWAFPVILPDGVIVRDATRVMRLGVRSE
jgi:outer membrane protein assembly factor BamB